MSNKGHRYFTRKIFERLDKELSDRYEDYFTGFEVDFNERRDIVPISHPNGDWDVVGYDGDSLWIYEVKDRPDSIVSDAWWQYQCAEDLAAVNDLNLFFSIVNTHNRFGELYEALEDLGDFFKSEEVIGRVKDSPLEEEDLVRGRLLSKLEWMDNGAEGIQRSVPSYFQVDKMIENNLLERDGNHLKPTEELNKYLEAKEFEVYHKTPLWNKISDKEEVFEEISDDVDMLLDQE